MTALKQFAIPLALGVLALVAVLVVATAQNRAVIASAVPTATVSAPPRALSATATPIALAKSSNRAPTRKVTGNLIAEKQVTLMFEMPGRVKEIAVTEGDRVRAGAVLASIDTRLLELQVAQAQAGLDAANATLDRTKSGPNADEVAVARANLDSAQAALRLAQAAYDRIGGGDNPYIGMLPESLALQQAENAYRAAAGAYNLTVNHPTATELKTVKSQVAQAQAALDLAKQNAANARIVAPFDGTVMWVGAKVGEMGVPGAPALTLADMSSMQAQAPVDEILLSSIQVGQKVTLTVDALGGKMLTGRVAKIGMLAVATSGIVNVPITIDVDPTDAPIRPGLSAQVEF